MNTEEKLNNFKRIIVLLYDEVISNNVDLKTIKKLNKIIDNIEDSEYEYIIDNNIVIPGLKELCNISFQYIRSENNNSYFLGYIYYLIEQYYDNIDRIKHEKVFNILNSKQIKLVF